MSRPISAAYLERKLRAITSVGGSNPLPDASDLAGLLVIESDRPEWGKAGGEELLAGNITANMVAQFGAVRKRNPVASGVLAIIESIEIFTNLATTYIVRVGMSPTADLAGASLVRSARDSRNRNAGTQTSCAVIDSTQVAAADPGGGQEIRRVLIPLNGVDKVDQVPFVLGPDSFIEVASVAAVTAILIVQFAWRERPVEGGFEVK